MLTGPFEARASLVLASGSPRRRTFLEDLGLQFRIVLPHRAEAVRWSGEAPGAFARRAASAKAEDVAAREPASAVLAADTIVSLDGEIMGKPRSHEEGLAMLVKLSGRTHSVFTACCLMLPGGGREERTVEAKVTMAPHDTATLKAYVHTGEGEDKAGSYAVQGRGAFLVERIEGSWSGVAGLPLAEVTQMLLAHGLIGPRQPPARHF